MTFNEDRGNAQIPAYSPSSKKEILEQEEYQTESRGRVEARTVPNYIKEYEQKLQFPTKALNFIQQNNELLSKYEKKDEPREEAREDKEIPDQSGKDYFSNN